VSSHRRGPSSWHERLQLSPPPLPAGPVGLDRFTEGHPLPTDARPFKIITRDGVKYAKHNTGRTPLHDAALAVLPSRGFGPASTVVYVRGLLDRDEIDVNVRQKMHGYVRSSLARPASLTPFADAAHGAH
jgi:hypothetical protein